MKTAFLPPALPSYTLLSSALPGSEGLLCKELLSIHPDHTIVFIVKDEDRLDEVCDLLRFFLPGQQILSFPNWDTLPYDRTSPQPEVIAERLKTLTFLLERSRQPSTTQPPVVVTTIAAFTQKLPPHQSLDRGSLTLCRGTTFNQDKFLEFCTQYGYSRVSTVRDGGEFAIRGGIIDLYPQGFDLPVRLDLFGDEIEKIRHFDPLTQCSTLEIKEVVLNPIGEIILDPSTISRFRTGYRSLFGGRLEEDQLYTAISSGVRHPGFENWLPLFYENLETLSDYLIKPLYVLEDQFKALVTSRHDQILEHYQGRLELCQSKNIKTPYNPLVPETLYLDLPQVEKILNKAPVIQLSPFVQDLETEDYKIDLRAERLPEYLAIRNNPQTHMFDKVVEDVNGWLQKSQRIVFACYSQGSAERLQHLLQEHGLQSLRNVTDYKDLMQLPKNNVGIAVFPLKASFKLPFGKGLILLSEADLLGERLARKPKSRKKADLFFAEVNNLNPGDLVVHEDHGIGQFEGLVTIEVANADHDCVALTYANGDKLFVPVENLDVLSRYGGQDSLAELDKLGSSHWQLRKAKVKEKIQKIAEHLIELAAQRQLRVTEGIEPLEGLYEEFCARFAYAETDDQLRAIEETLEDLQGTRPMDRLICGDVGFGKTEVALRAAFIVAAAGKQVALVVPTTLLCRQHFKNFKERLNGFGLRVEMLSRLTPPKHAQEVKAQLAEGKVDIVIATHALLAKTVQIKNLGLLIVDEEQHFGVAQKERLKALKSDVHVLTLTATPIPRTLQMALSGVREMSIIATPPIDRMAVRTFVMPFEGGVIREAILREHYRGGQTFYVCPRVSDLAEVSQELKKLVPEVRVIVAHGGLSPTELERVMDDFCEKRADVLLATNIIESGIDIATANTMIVHRADMFGLAQLYQLRGRIGRARVRAYAYLTLPPHKVLTPTAQKRLEVMQTLDTLGAGFQIASYDMDIRGAGNLVGEEQSGHIREVGVELYQQLLEEAIEKVQGENAKTPSVEHWVPQIHLGIAVLIPETYVTDLSIRLGLYRRLTTLETFDDIDAFGIELMDRFGSLPQEVKNLLEIMKVKLLCRHVGVEKIEAGEKGAVLTFRNNTFDKPEKLLMYINAQKGTVKIRPDHKLVILRVWPDLAARTQGVTKLIQELAKL